MLSLADQRLCVDNVQVDQAEGTRRVASNCQVCLTEWKSAEEIVFKYRKLPYN